MMQATPNEDNSSDSNRPTGRDSEPPAPTPEPELQRDDLSSLQPPQRGDIRPDLIGLSREERALLTEPLPVDLTPEQFKQTWTDYQETIQGLLIRMGRENGLTNQVTRLPWVRDLESFKIRLSLLPMVGDSLQRSLGEGKPGDLIHRLAGECSLMELSAAAGYRTFCFPPLVRGLLKSGKMRDNASQRMLDTFEFLNTMVQYPADHPRTIQQLDRANGLHRKHRVAGSATEEQRDLFKYIALNMFYVGPRMRPDLTPQEKHAICGLTLLVSQKMGHTIEGSVVDLENFIDRYEQENMFDLDDNSAIRRQAIRIGQESQKALTKFPVVSKERIHGMIPHRVKQILQID